MDMTGEQRIPASRKTVWDALNDPDILKACIPGCQELIKSSDTEFAATAVIKVGPISARFRGAVTLSDLDPPHSYRITGEGQGGVAGFAKGTALVRLEEEGPDTVLAYDVSAQVGGKLSQIGGRLIDTTARQLSAAFFKRFAEEIDTRSGLDLKREADTGPARAPSHAPLPRPGSRMPRSGLAPAGRTLARLNVLGVIGGFGLAVLLGLAWLLFGGSLPSLATAGSRLSADFGSAILFFIVAAIGYLFGRQHATRAILVDRDLIEEILAQSARREQGAP